MTDRRKLADLWFDNCPSCGVSVGSLPYDWSGRPKIIVCFSHDPPAVYCEMCDTRQHASCGKLRKEMVK